MNWSEEFNRLPNHIRMIGSAQSSLTRIQQLNIEKDRLRVALKKAVGDIDAVIRNCEDHLKRLEKEWLTLRTNDAAAESK